MSLNPTILEMPGNKVKGADIPSQDQPSVRVENGGLHEVDGSPTQISSGAEQNDFEDESINLATVFSESVNDYSCEHAHHEECHGLIDNDIEISSDTTQEEETGSPTQLSISSGAERNDYLNQATGFTESVNDNSEEHARHEECHDLPDKDIKTSSDAADEETGSPTQLSISSGAERNDSLNLATGFTESVNDNIEEHARHEECQDLPEMEIKTSDDTVKVDQEGGTCYVDVGATLLRCNNATWFGERANNVSAGWWWKRSDHADYLRIMLYLVGSMMIMFDWYFGIKAVKYHDRVGWNLAEVTSLVSLIVGIFMTWPLLPLYHSAIVTGQADKEMKLNCLRFEILHVVYESVPQVGVYLYTAWESGRIMNYGDVFSILAPLVFTCAVMFKVFTFPKLKRNIVLQTIGRGFEFSVAVFIPILILSIFVRSLSGHPTSIQNSFITDPYILFIPVYLLSLTIFLLSVFYVIAYFLFITYWVCPPRYGKYIWNLTNENEFVFHDFIKGKLGFDRLAFYLVLTGISLNLIVWALFVRVHVFFPIAFNVVIFVHMSFVVKSVTEFQNFDEQFQSE